METIDPFQELQQPIPRVFTQRMADRRTELMAAQAAAQQAEGERISALNAQGLAAEERRIMDQEAKEAAIMESDARRVMNVDPIARAQAQQIMRKNFDPSSGGINIGSLI
jgi:hypothetical protein